MFAVNGYGGIVKKKKKNEKRTYGLFAITNIHWERTLGSVVPSYLSLFCPSHRSRSNDLQTCPRTIVVGHFRQRSVRFVPDHLITNVCPRVHRRRESSTNIARRVPDCGRSSHVVFLCLCRARVRRPRRASRLSRGLCRTVGERGGSRTENVYRNSLRTNVYP